MQLSNISTVVRPRSKWQAVDLGFKMASKWYRSLFTGWVMISLPIFLLLHLVLFDYSWAAILIFWWLKPLWERIQLGYLSAAQFGEHSTLKQQFKRWLSVLSRQWLATLLWRRFSQQRSYSAPVVQLENLSGTRRQKRLALFDGENQQAAFWITIVLMHLEFFITMAVYALVVFLIPAEADIDVTFYDLLTNTTLGGNFLAYFSMALVAPFFVSSGFSLYLNQRTHIEGWDIEITFRRMVERQQQKRRPAASLLPMLMLVMFSSILMTNGSMAAQLKQETTAIEAKSPQQQRAYELAQEVAKSEHFNQVEITSYPAFYLDMKVNQDEQEPTSSAPWLKTLILFLANSVELLLTILVVTIVVLVLYRYRHWLAQFVPGGIAQPSSAKPKPTSIFGLDIDEDTMPDDPSEQARLLWQQGKKRQSLSLLYRGSLLMLVNKEQLVVHDSFTEGECMAQVNQNAQPQTSAYFQQLTSNWQRLAYANIMPQEQSMLALFDQWHEIFSEPTDEQ